jgi:hypothetical protein
LLSFNHCNGFKFLFGNQQCQEDRCTWLDCSPWVGVSSFKSLFRIWKPKPRSFQKRIVPFHIFMFGRLYWGWVQKCSIPLYCGIKIYGSYAVMPKIPDKNMMEWGILGATIMCLLDIKAYKHMTEDFTWKTSASDLIQCRKFEWALRLLKM